MLSDLTPLVTSHAFPNASQEAGDVKLKVVKSKLSSPLVVPASPALDSYVAIGIATSSCAPFVVEHIVSN